MSREIIPPGTNFSTNVTCLFIIMLFVMFIVTSLAPSSIFTLVTLKLGTMDIDKMIFPAFHCLSAMVVPRAAIRLQFIRRWREFEYFITRDTLNYFLFESARNFARKCVAHCFWPANVCTSVIDELILGMPMDSDFITERIFQMIFFPTVYHFIPKIQIFIFVMKFDAVRKSDGGYSIRYSLYDIRYNRKQYFSLFPIKRKSKKFCFLLERNFS